MQILTHGLPGNLRLNTDSAPGTPPPSDSVAPTGGAETTIPAPQSAPQPPETEKPAHDAPRKNDAPKTGLAERLRRKAGNLFSKAGFKKGKGRPKKCRSCGGDGCEECEFTGVEPGAGDVPENPGDDGPESGEPAAPVATGEPASPGAGVSAPPVNSDGGKIFNEALESGLEVTLDVADTISGFALDYAGHSPDFTEQAIARARARSAKNISRLSEALKLWFEEDKIVIEKPGKKAAMINGAAFLLPYVLLIQEARAEAARRRREGK